MQILLKIVKRLASNTVGYLVNVSACAAGILATAIDNLQYSLNLQSVVYYRPSLKLHWRLDSSLLLTMYPNSGDASITKNNE